MEFRDADGEVRRAELKRGASEEDVIALLGPPARVVEYPRADYWIYSFAGARLDYVFVFREHALRRVQYVDRRGERP